MYAVIRTGGKQYRVAPGDVIRVEKFAPETEGDNEFQFNEVLAVSSDEGKVSRASDDVRVTGRVLGEGRGEKILVFHYKRKKQYKKLQGHRQPFTAVQITEITADGQTFKADQAKLKQPAKPKAEAAAAVEAKPAKKAARKTAKKAAPKKAAAKKAAPKKK
jgi:large subunit ribosomal protein L21